MMRIISRDSIALTAGAFLLLAPMSARAQTPGDLSAIKQAITHLKRGDTAKALNAAAQIQEPAGKALVTWLAIRAAPNEVGFERMVQFMRERPNWPNQTLIRRRAEKQLYDDEKDAATVRAFFAQSRV